MRIGRKYRHEVKVVEWETFVEDHSRAYKFVSSEEIRAIADLEWFKLVKKERPCRSGMVKRQSLVDRIRKGPLGPNE